MTPFQQAILLNLYRQQTKKNGRIDLPTIEILVHNFRDSSPLNNPPDNIKEIPPINAPIVASNQHLEVNNQSNQIINGNTTNNGTHSSIEPPINELTNSEIDREVIEGETVETKAENNSSSNHQIEYNLEKIILELYLQEVAQKLAKPSKKSLKPIFFPNINEFLKDINQ